MTGKTKINQFKWLAATLMFVAAMVMPSTAWAQITLTQPSVGDGSAKKPYQISSRDELYWFAEYVNGDPGKDNGNKTACAVLTDDIEVNPRVLTSDGSLNGTPLYHWPKIMEYNGTFDGKGHTISGLFFYTNANDEAYSGLFATTHSNAEILNLGIVDSYFHEDCMVGGVCGWNSGTIKNCYNKSTVSGKSSLGGVCGRNDGTIENCFNTGRITDGDAIGGVCGDNCGTIKNCYNTGTISGHSAVGGVCGSNLENGTITNCYYLSGTATAGISINGGTGSAEVKTAYQFNRGEVAWLLNGGKTDGSQAWYQALSGEGYPNLNKDTKNRTVYGAYKHGETSPTCSNSKSDLAMFHAHAYDSSAIDEANGNHDMACEQNENNPYTWEDIDNYSNATAQCNFKCSVCNSEVAKDMTVTPDGDKTNEPAKCIEKGHNYYVASLTFNGTTYTKDYTQEVPVLGHDKSGDVTFNSGNKIYEKVCKREGCGETIYYANAAGTIEAIPNAGVTAFTVANYPLQDATTYDNKAVFTATKFTYTRTFSNTNWTTWYVPFDLTLTSDICAQYEFSRINNVHQYDTDNDGTADKTVVESFRQMPGVTLKANYPYLVKPVSESDLNMLLPLEGVKPALAMTNSIDCQSVDFSYTFTGTYVVKSGNGTAPTDPYTICEDNKWMHFASLNPMRHYLTIQSRNASSLSPASMRSIMLSVVGEENTTGIVKIYDEERRASETYDISGRRLPAGSQRGLVIENGKVIFKK